MTAFISFLMRSALTVNQLPLYASLLLGLALLSYAAVRACTVGFTHDESSSFMNLLHEPVADLFFHPRNWQAANNHLLNTLCMQIGHYFFGPEEWALRWGSLVGGLIYLIYAFRSVRLWLPMDAWWFFGAFCVLTLHHFTLDFFSLARGYGLCLAFEMAALFYFFRWIKREASLDLLKAGCALGLGILANFTLLDFMAAFLATVTVVYYVKSKGRFSPQEWLRLMLWPALPLLATLLLIFQPMRWISAQGEFEYGPQAFWETWRVLVERFVYNPFPGALWYKVVVLLVATTLFAGLGYAIFKRYRSAGLQASPTLFYATLLTVLTMLTTVAQHYLLGANYLSGRTAVLFYPLLATVVVLFLIDLKPRLPQARLLWLLVCGGLAINFICQANLRYALEWQYDENTKAAVFFANQQGDATHPVHYGVGWLFYSTTMFYQQTRALHNVQTVAYNAGHDDLAWIRSRPFELILVEEKLQPQLEDSFAVLQHYPQAVIMRRK